MTGVQTCALPISWRFFLPWFWPAEDKVVLGSTFCQFGFPSLFLGHFFLLSVGLGLEMEWAKASKTFWPHTHTHTHTHTHIYIYIKTPYSYQPRSFSLFLNFFFKFLNFYMLHYVESTLFFFSFFIHSVHMTFFFNSSFYGIKTKTLIRYL